MSTATIPAGYKPITYLMDAETEDLIYGEELRDGMVVVIADTILSPDPDSGRELHPYEQRRLLECARWCRVERMRREGHVVSFIGVYADGSKFPRSYAASYTWYVKRASMAGAS